MGKAKSGWGKFWVLLMMSKKARNKAFSTPDTILVPWGDFMLVFQRPVEMGLQEKLIQDLNKLQSNSNR